MDMCFLELNFYFNILKYPKFSSFFPAKFRKCPKKIVKERVGRVILNDNVAICD